jgi:hypothetical protein
MGPNIHVYIKEYLQADKVLVVVLRYTQSFRNWFVATIVTTTFSITL